MWNKSILGATVPVTHRRPQAAVGESARFGFPHWKDNRVHVLPLSLATNRKQSPQPSIKPAGIELCALGFSIFRRHPLVPSVLTSINCAQKRPNYFLKSADFLCAASAYKVPAEKKSIIIWAVLADMLPAVGQKHQAGEQPMPYGRSFLFVDSNRPFYLQIAGLHTFNDGSESNFLIWNPQWKDMRSGTQTYLKVFFFWLGILQFSFETIDFTLWFLNLLLQLFCFCPAPFPFGLVHPQLGQSPSQFRLV